MSRAVYGLAALCALFIAMEATTPTFQGTVLVETPQDQPSVLVAVTDEAVLSDAVTAPSSRKGSSTTIALSDAGTADAATDDTAFNFCKPLGKHPYVINSYRCAGDIYEQFADRLHQLVESEAKSSSTWGRRSEMVPMGSPQTNERAILVMGNSHVRQITRAIMCQYRHQAVGKRHVFLDDLMEFSFQFKGNKALKIYTSFNDPITYSPDWKQALEAPYALNRTLESLDAIIMGYFNELEGNMGTNFAKNIIQQAKDHPELGIDTKKLGIRLLPEVAGAYPGPIVYVGQFAKNFQFKYVKAERFQRDSNRTNIRTINARKYVNKLESMMSHKEKAKTPFYECVTDVQRDVGTCNLDKKSRRFANGHRCMGEKGGHPDLVAWDVIEALHEMLQPSDP